MKISIAICTWNRCRLLQQTLRHMAEMTIPDSIAWEVVVVDNGSTDDTRQVIDEFSGALPVRYVFESQQGHSVSRNTAVANVTGNYILWTDNDVIVDKNWLKEYATGFQKHPDIDYFGGKITPVFESGKPAWLGETWDKCKAVYADRDLGDQEMELGSGTFPYGANFAVRTDVQQQFLFDTGHGRKGDGMMGDDEISALRRIDQAGHTGLWLPNASLQHFISADRTTLDYVARYFVGQGQTNILQGKVVKTLREAWFESIRNKIAFHLKRPWKQPDEWVSHLIRASLSRGEYIALKNGVHQKGTALS